MSIDARPGALAGLLLIRPRAHHDERGFFSELWRSHEYEAAGVVGPFVQDNVAFSRHGVLRGLHYQHPHAQGKLISVVSGAVFDVAVDLRRSSPTFGRWEAFALTSENHHQVWIPPGFAHGYQVLSETAVLCYKCTDFYAAAYESVLLWSDPEIGIAWPIADASVSVKDQGGTLLRDLPPDRLFK